MSQSPVLEVLSNLPFASTISNLLSNELLSVSGQSCRLFIRLQVALLKCQSTDHCGLHVFVAPQKVLHSHDAACTKSGRLCLVTVALDAGMFVWLSTDCHICAIEYRVLHKLVQVQENLLLHASSCSASSKTNTHCCITYRLQFASKADTYHR